MNEYRTYDAGELEQLRDITREQQLENPANFIGQEGNLYLVRCMACGDTPLGRENYLPAVATGTCTWCGWTT